MYKSKSINSLSNEKFNIHTLDRIIFFIDAATFHDVKYQNIQSIKIVLYCDTFNHYVHKNLVLHNAVTIVHTSDLTLLFT